MVSQIDTYEQYKAPGLEKKKIAQADILPLLETLPALFHVTEIGQSFEGRTLYGIRVGSGATRV
ncbi:MAG: hypothetical protein LBT61_02780, partial [Prevotellaceae bacterium]|nr:hypothetical protein [Prevotellaceae bacterium]